MQVGMPRCGVTARVAAGGIRILRSAAVLKTSRSNIRDASRSEFF
jgi:hypothetical protein